MATATKTAGAADDYVLGDQVGHLLARAYGRAYLALRRTLADLDITPPQHAAIMKLYELDEASQNELGRRVAMEPATIHGIIRRLSARSLIAARQSPEDKRRNLLSLTPAGRELAHELAARSEETTAATLSSFSPSERRALDGLLRRLAEG